MYHTKCKMSIIGINDPNLESQSRSPYYPHKFAVNLTLLQIKIYVFLKGWKETKLEKQKKTGDF